MSNEFIGKLQYTFNGEGKAFPLSPLLKDSLHLISRFFRGNTNHKLCLVFPSKDYVAQWLSIPMTLALVEADYFEFKNEIAESLGRYKKGDWIILNNEAVVEWVGRDLSGFKFRHKEYYGVSEITISLKKISKIQPAPSTRKALSGYKRVMNSIGKNNEVPLDKLLGILSDGNKVFIRNSICLISKHILFENSIYEIAINCHQISEYFRQEKIDDAGEVDIHSPLLISNNLSNLALFITESDKISKIIIDGYSAIQEREIDFNDIDVKRIPTILITDLSEIEYFEKIGAHKFDFYNFTKENISLSEINKLSPFSEFEERTRKYVSFKIRKEVCDNEELEIVVKLMQEIEGAESNRELTNLKVLLIQITNSISRICHPLTINEINSYTDLLAKAELQFNQNKFYLEEYSTSLEDSILLLKNLIQKCAATYTDKCNKMNALFKMKQFDYVVCVTEEEALSLSNYLNSNRSRHFIKVISISELNKDVIAYGASTAMITGWAKGNNMSRLLSNFMFTELTVLFYQFECKYLDSLRRKNRRFSSSISSTVDMDGQGIIQDNSNDESFSDHYHERNADLINESKFDVIEFELRLDNAQFSKYIIKDNSNDSVKAKRVEFKNGKFIYLTDTHGLLVIENINKPSKKTLIVHKSRVEGLHQGDVIAFMNTERELLNRIVESQTTPSALKETVKWIEFWKSLLKDHFEYLNRDFNALIRDLRNSGCLRDPGTIRSWLFDELRIGPRKDDDLIAIAIMTNKTGLSDNIAKVRSSIRQMTSWRMKASDFVIEQLKFKILGLQASIKINSTIDFQDLGEVEILEITDIKSTYDNIDTRYVNRLLKRL